MTKRLPAIALSLIAAVLVFQPPRLRNQPVSAPTKSPASASRLGNVFEKLPLSFEPCVELSCGPANSTAKFVSRGHGYSFYLADGEAMFVLAPSAGRETKAMRMKLAGANSAPRMVGTDKLPGKTNYLLGNDPKKWRTNIANYAKIRYEDVYP